ncbi:MAG: tRNA lysidine(34) synthetase TilS [Prosthecobacter sp.]
MNCSAPSLACYPEGWALLGLSGGRDSVALLHLLLAAGHRNLVVCHLNHGLRGRESDEDAAFVRSLTEKHGLTCEIAKVNVKAKAVKNKLSIETAARQARHVFFKRMSRKHGTNHLLLAHHADDQAETILGNILRGCGLEGLAAMELVTDLKNGLCLMRPLLRVRRTEIDAYVQANSIPYREDSTNASPAHRRNRLRHEALPLLSEIAGRDVVPLLNRLGSIAERDESFLHQESSLWFQSCHEGHMLTKLNTLRDLDPAILSRVVAFWLREYLKLSDIGFEEIGHVSGLLHTEKPAKLNLPGSRFARRKGGRLWVE